MPELPEVETIVCDLTKSVNGAEITDYISYSPKQMLPSESIIKKNIIGAEIVGVERRGKVIVLSIKNQELRIKNKKVSRAKKGPVLRESKYLLIHLKMSGRLLLRGKNDPEDKYLIAVFELKDRNNKKIDLRFCDTRKFGFVKLLNSKIEKDSYFRKYGPEPLSTAFSLPYFIDKLKNCKRTIKSVIMDPEVVTGAGNIYANEALYLAGIRPNRPGGQLKKSEIVKLLNCIKKVLKKGIKFRGSSSRDESYKDLFGNMGSYQKHFLVYERKGELCQKCGGVIEYMKVSGRGTFWCQGCQK